MSRFIDKLKQVSPAVSQPMGFGVRQPVSVKPKMLLVASLAQADVDRLADYVAGADAGLLLVKAGSGVKSLPKIARAVSDIPWGVWLAGSQQEIKQMAKVGGDFAVFPAASTPLAAFQDDEVGKILEVEPSLSEGLLRAVNEMPVDAVLVAGEPGEADFLSWQHLALFWRFAGLLTKPLLVTVPLKVTAGELQALCEAGVDGVVVAVAAGQPQDRLKELRRVIDKLAPSRQRGKVAVSLPAVGGGASAAAEEEDEEDE